ncbi:RHS repeat domain-containing protein, partial [Rhizobium rhizogenes]|uniref:RHS repeat domain-containing protein n=1 Tax=Rhizobium rhizogenes TaxID=359 RepID=UPI001147645C
MRAPEIRPVQDCNAVATASKTEFRSFNDPRTKAYNKPTAIGRVLDDGTSQISIYAYDSNGNLTQATDPSGRITYYAYTDGIDVAAVSQAGEFGTRSTLAQYIYNKQ